MDTFFVCPYTNKKVASIDVAIDRSPVFWCDACSLKLESPGIAVTHINGHSHRAKMKLLELLEETFCKRKFDDRTNLKVEICASEVSSAKKTKKDIAGTFQDDFFCHDCSIQLNSKATFEIHLSGKKHLSKVEAKKKHSTNEVGIEEQASSKKSPLHCDTCSIQLNSQAALDIHLTGKKHKNNLSNISCSDCCISLNSEAALKLHMNGKKHLSKVQENQRTQMHSGGSKNKGFSRPQPVENKLFDPFGYADGCSDPSKIKGLPQPRHQEYEQFDPFGSYYDDSWPHYGNMLGDNCYDDNRASRFKNKIDWSMKGRGATHGKPWLFGSPKTTETAEKKRGRGRGRFRGRGKRKGTVSTTRGVATVAGVKDNIINYFVKSK